ncbi:MAG: RidA family protein [Deltaproteobacteria bacterium]|nr:RidA family protein [Deltaproteobacteria bacterium]
MKERIVPDTMAKPVGEYSHATKVTAKQLIFIAGQVPIDKDGNVVGVDRNDKLRNHQTIDLAAQVRQTMLNVKAALEAAGASFSDLVRVDTFVVASAMNEYRTIGVKTKHEILGVRVGGATVFVAGLMIPEALIEISAVAAID